MKAQILSVVKGATAASAIAFIQYLDADAPQAWIDAPIWPVIGAVSTYAIIEIGKWSKS